MRDYLVKRMIIFSLFTNLILILTFTDLGYPKFGVINSTIIHIPVMVGILYFKNLKFSLGLGLVFGLSSWSKVWLVPTSSFDLLFLNPIISIIPRILFAFFTHYLLVNKTKIWIFINSFIATYIHSLLVLTSLWVVYAQTIEKLTGTNIFNFVLSLLIASSFVESILAMLLILPIQMALKDQQ